MNLLKSAANGACFLSLMIPAASGTSGEIATFAEPYRDIDVASSEMGTIAYIHVKEGDLVEAGQVLGGLDESVLKAALLAAKSAKEATGRLTSAEAELAMQSDRLEKIKQLLSRRHASDEELARAESQVRMAAAQVLAVREELAIKAAEYDRIEAQLNQKRIFSPIDGIVTAVFKDVGEFVSASDPVVAKIVQLDQLRAEFSVPQHSLGDLRHGQEVDLEIGARRSKCKGAVEFVSPITDAQSNTVRVRIRIDNQGGHLHSGDSCWLATDSSSSSLSGGQLIKTKEHGKSKSGRNID